MIFLMLGSKARTEKNIGRLERKVLATTNSEGGISEFMVRSQLRKQCQTSALKLMDKCCNNGGDFEPLKISRGWAYNEVRS